MPFFWRPVGCGWAFDRRRRKTRPQQGTVLIKLTSTQEITPYKWVHPDEAR
jgi:hypothetical protein